MKKILLAITLLFAFSCKKNNTITPDIKEDPKILQKYSYNIGNPYSYAYLISYTSNVNGIKSEPRNVGSIVELDSVKSGDIIYLDMNFRADGNIDSACVYLNDKLVKKEYDDKHITITYTVN